MKILEELKKEVLNVSKEIIRENFNLYYENLKRGNLLILGIRQIGKTTLSKQLMNQYINDHKLKNNEFLVLDFRVKIISKNFQNIISNSPNTKIIFIDEVQLLEDWNNEFQALIDLYKNKKFILTGSNSIQLRMNNFVGRATQFVLKPLSWKEFKLFWQGDFNDYLNYGSFPKRNTLNELIPQNSLLSEQVIKDIVRDDLKNKINLDKFMLFSSKILNYIGSEVKTTKMIAKSSLESRTGKEYLDILINAGVIEMISNFYDKSLNSKNKKIYFTDLGLINYFNDYKDHNSNIESSLIENTVYNFLSSNLNKLFDDKKVFYFKDDKEVDFIIPSLKVAIEVKYSNDNDYLQQGIDNLLSLKFANYQKILITKGINKVDLTSGIKMISLQKFIETFFVNKMTKVS